MKVEEKIKKRITSDLIPEVGSRLEQEERKQL